MIKDAYYWLTKLAYKMILYHDTSFHKWCERHTKWQKKWEEKHGMEVE